jgi:hypothetical protein
VFIEGRQLLTLLDGFFRAAVADCPAIQAAAAAGGDGGGGSSHSDTVASSVYGAVPVLEAVGCAAAVAALLVSHLQGFLAAAGVRLPAGEPACCMLLVENLVGAAAYMTRVQHSARMAPGRQAASKQAAARQAAMLNVDGAAVSEWLWLWLVAMVTQHDWHATLAQTSGGVSMFLEAAGSRCCWLAQQDEQQQQVEAAAAAAGDAGGGGGAGFMDWLSEQQQQRPGGAAAAASGRQPDDDDVIEIED